MRLIIDGMKLAIIGKQKALCLAELESVFNNVRYSGGDAALFENKETPDINKMGGTIKIGDVIGSLDSTASDQAVSMIVDYIKSLEKNKINFGISSYEKKLNANAISIKVKSILKQSGTKVRHVRSENNILNAASIKHNKLTRGGLEILVAKVGGGFILASTIAAQDVDSYSKRDYEKPCRDTKVGMLPPKLAQILINLAQPGTDEIIVDPFCGSGTVLMESMIMGLNSEGSDISEAMINCSKKNCQWMKDSLKNEAVNNVKTTILDACDASSRKYEYSNYSVVTEGYLGENFSYKPTMDQVNKQLDSSRRLYESFLKNIIDQTKKPKTVVLCLPFWVRDSKPIKLEIIDYILSLGYTIKDFEFADSSNLLYYREDQNTGRQILVLKISK